MDVAVKITTVKCIDPSQSAWVNKNEHLQVRKESLYLEQLTFEHCRVLTAAAFQGQRGPKDAKAAVEDSLKVCTVSS